MIFAQLSPSLWQNLLTEPFFQIFHSFFLSSKQMVQVSLSSFLLRILMKRKYNFWKIGSLKSFLQSNEKIYDHNIRIFPNAYISHSNHILLAWLEINLLHLKTFFLILSTGYAVTPAYRGRSMKKSMTITFEYSLMPIYHILIIFYLLDLK